jgi:hypothetical protein
MYFCQGLKRERMGVMCKVGTIQYMMSVEWVGEVGGKGGGWEKRRREERRKIEKKSKN